MISVANVHPKTHKNMAPAKRCHKKLSKFKSYTQCFTDDVSQRHTQYAS